VEFGEFAAHANAQLGVEIRQGFVEKKDLGLANNRATDRDPLALAARQILGLALQQMLDVQDSRRVHDRCIDFDFWNLGEFEPEGRIRRTYSGADTARKTEKPSPRRVRRVVRR
jgi:hypothetical protein